MTATVRYFPLLAAGFAAAAFIFPGVFLPLGPLIVPLLGLVMFGMGLTLTYADFRRILERPWVIGLGVVFHFLFMPLLAWIIARALALSPELTTGLILVGSCPGGTASNVVAFLARGDVALSVTITATTTLLAVIATPALTWAYAGAAVPVPVTAMLLSILYVVVIPVAGGVAASALRPKLAARVKPALPAISVAAIVTIIGIVVALNRGQMAAAGPVIALAVMIHNLAGLFGGYWAARLLGLSEPECRTIGIEVGMQNSGLGVALALKYFSAAAALPSAIFSIWHNLSGAAVAAFWARGDRSEA